ncbi:hypothetical protein OIV83_002282 [Microbotryomycetes sp. JL201]|nr:hypothetical protein OIV83_002282 [Microbotryomycetes sp. JL201]
MSAPSAGLGVQQPLDVQTSVEHLAATYDIASSDKHGFQGAVDPASVMWRAHRGSQLTSGPAAAPALFAHAAAHHDQPFDSLGLGGTYEGRSDAAHDVKPVVDGGGASGDGDLRESQSGPVKRKAQSKAHAEKPSLARGLACTVCRKRKLRPECGTCVRLGHQCVYGDPVHEKLHERIKDLEAKMESMQLELDGYRAADKQVDHTPHRPDLLDLPLSNPPPVPDLPSFDAATMAQVDAFSQSTGLVSPNVLGQAQIGPAFASPNTASPSHQTAHGGAKVLGAPPHAPVSGVDVSQLHAYNGDYAPEPAGANLSGFNSTSPGAGSSPASAKPALSTPYHTSELKLGPAPASVPLSVPDSAYHLAASQSPSVAPFPLDSTTLLPHMLNGSDWQNESGVSTTWGSELPSYPIMLELATLYFGTVHQHFPFLHRSRFLYSLNNPTSLTSPPSLSLIFAVLAIAASYHDAPHIRSSASHFYTQARDKVELALNVGVQGRRGRTVATLTVEIVQALSLLTMIEMSNSDHQRAHLTIGQAVRVAAMLGLHRMDEDRIESLEGSHGRSQRRLRPPALHALPTDPVLLEECRRTMCTVFCLDRFESGCIGWPPAISELDIRLLLPCSDHLYDNGVCSFSDNPLWWPSSMVLDTNEHQIGPSVSPFGWLIRVLWLAGRIQEETYRSAGRPAAGPWSNFDVAPVDDVGRVVSMDQALDFLRARVTQDASVSMTRTRLVDGPLVMTLLVIHCSYINLHHLRVGVGMSKVPFDPQGQVIVGSAEYSMSRCIEAIKALVDIMTQLTVYENSRTSLYGSRISTFTAFVPYTCYCIVFPARFTTGDWAVIGGLYAVNRYRQCELMRNVSEAQSRTREENVTARVSATSVPSGDDVFGPAMDDYRVNALDTFCESLERMGTVWPIGKKFAALVQADRAKLWSMIISRGNGGGRPAGVRQQQQQQQQSPALQSGKLTY